MEAKATARFVRVAPTKVRRVANGLQGRPASEVVRTLSVDDRSGATDLSKTVRSACANAEDRFGVDEDELTVAGLAVDEGPTLRRFQPRAMGRATPIRKRTSHITAVVSTQAGRTVPAGAGRSVQNDDVGEGE